MAAAAVVAVIGGCGALPIDAFPLTPGARECIGVPVATCATLASQHQELLGPALVAYRIRCSSAICTPEAGNAEVMILRADGTSDVSSAFWAGG